jgi:cold-inducible RNA-binding protein
VSKKLYVGGLAYAVTDDQLKDFFAAFGEVTSAQVIMDRATGRSKGFGFVEMANDTEALKAIEELNDKEFLGRTINVNEARPMEKRESRPSNGGGYGGGDRNRGGSRGGDRRSDSGRRY